MSKPEATPVEVAPEVKPAAVEPTTITKQDIDDGGNIAETLQQSSNFPTTPEDRDLWTQDRKEMYKEVQKDMGTEEGLNRLKENLTFTPNPNNGLGISELTPEKANLSQLTQLDPASKAFLDSVFSVVDSKATAGEKTTALSSIVSNFDFLQQGLAKNSLQDTEKTAGALQKSVQEAQERETNGGTKFSELIQNHLTKFVENTASKMADTIANMASNDAPKIGQPAVPQQPTQGGGQGGQSGGAGAEEGAAAKQPSRQQNAAKKDGPEIPEKPKDGKGDAVKDAATKGAMVVAAAVLAATAGPLVAAIAIIAIISWFAKKSHDADEKRKDAAERDKGAKEESLTPPNQQDLEAALQATGNDTKLAASVMQNVGELQRDSQEIDRGAGTAAEGGAEVAGAEGDAKPPKEKPDPDQAIAGITPKGADSGENPTAESQATMNDTAQALLTDVNKELKTMSDELRQAQTALGNSSQQSLEQDDMTQENLKPSVKSWVDRTKSPAATTPTTTTAENTGR